MIEHRSGYGRVVVASHDMEIGDVVIDEAPLLTWHNEPNDVANYLAAFRCAPIAAQAAIRDMYSPRGDLVEIRFTNAHQYGQKRSALFELGSKLSHSCLPNAAYKLQEGRAQFVAIRHVKAGEQITFSYRGNCWSTPTHERRKYLKDRYFFECGCPLCDGPDLSRALRCPGCDGFVRLFDTTWFCDTCGPQNPSLAEESAILNEFRRARRVDDLLLLARRASDRLSPTHYVVARIFHRIEQYYAATALSSPPAHEHAALAGFKVAATFECMAAGCTGGCSPTSHAPFYESLEPARRAMRHLSQLHRHYIPLSVSLLHHARKYFLFL